MGRRLLRFDNRVSVNHNLEKGDYEQCFACRMPITEADQQSIAYIKGESCPHCIDKATDEQKARFREREHQMQLAQKRGEVHIGSEVVDVIENAKPLKLKHAVRLMLQIKPKQINFIWVTY